MLFALGAVSSALDALQSLATSKTASAQQSNSPQGGSNPFTINGSPTGTASSAPSPAATGGGSISPETMSALISAQSQSSTSATSTPASRSSRDAALKDLFSQIDADGDGKITKSEFEEALGAGGTNLAQADDVFSKLDANGDGNVSLDEMSKALKSGHHGHRHAGNADESGDGAQQSGGGSTRTTVVNSDGSTTTTVKYADGFKVTMTVPGASGAGDSAYNMFEQMMQRGGQAGAGAPTASALSMTA